MTTVVLLRHGRTSANATGILAGRSPGVALDEHGRTQAATAAERLAGAPIAAIVSSPLQRCRQTAAAVAEPHALTVATDTGLVEAGYGDWTGRPLKELAKEPLWRTVQSQPSAVRFPGGESMLEMASRAQQTIHDLNSRITCEHGADAVWVAVSHGDVIKAILAGALGVHLDLFQRILVDPASISVLRLSDTGTAVACMNTTAGDLTAMLTPPKKGRRRRRTGPQVGGGLGTAD